MPELLAGESSQWAGQEWRPWGSGPPDCGDGCPGPEDPGLHSLPIREQRQLLNAEGGEQGEVEETRGTAAPRRQLGRLWNLGSQPGCTSGF